MTNYPDIFSKKVQNYASHGISYAIMGHLIFPWVGLLIGGVIGITVGESVSFKLANEENTMENCLILKYKQLRDLQNLERDYYIEEGIKNNPSLKSFFTLPGLNHILRALPKVLNFEIDLNKNICDSGLTFLKIFTLLTSWPLSIIAFTAEVWKYAKEECAIDNSYPKGSEGLKIHQTETLREFMDIAGINKEKQLETIKTNIKYLKYENIQELVNACYTADKSENSYDNSEKDDNKILGFFTIPKKLRDVFRYTEELLHDSSDDSSRIPRPLREYFKPELINNDSSNLSMSISATNFEEYAEVPPSVPRRRNIRHNDKVTNKTAISRSSEKRSEKHPEKNLKPL